MSYVRVNIQKTIKVFSITGLIHTLISVVTFILSVLNWYWGKEVFYYTLKGLSLAQLLNSLIWLICGFKLVAQAKQLNNPKSVHNTRIVLLVSFWLVLTPDILMVLLFFLPSLSTNQFINIIGFISPVLVFIGWFVGKRMCKKIGNKVPKKED